jgi:hypothetical protein
MSDFSKHKAIILAGTQYLIHISGFIEKPTLDLQNTVCRSNLNLQKTSYNKSNLIPIPLQQRVWRIFKKIFFTG